MNKINKSIRFGEEVDGYAVPVLNEREIRASAGILFLFLLISLMFILFKQNFLLVKYVILIFFTDFIIRVFIGPRFSPTLIIGRLIVSRQSPEYVGAAQKKFAWKIGMALSALMLFLMVILNSYSIITGLTCLVCLLFLFFESAFGICLGCLFYGLFYKSQPLYCPGETCEPRKKQAIQKVSYVQLFILLGFVVFVYVADVFLNGYFSQAPDNLFRIIRSL
jgi:Domain of unknown function (DUF4395)